VFGAGATQVNLVISTAIASLLPTGAVSYLYYADRLDQLPLGVVGFAVGTAILPALARQVRLGDASGANETQNRGLELAFLLTLPAAVALGVAARPILEVLFERGAFGPADVAATSGALTAYAAGLPAFVLVKVMAPGFFARHDTATPVKIAFAAIAVNIVLTTTLGLLTPLAHVGIAMATSAAGWVNALLLIHFLRRRGHFAFDRRARRGLPRMLGAAIGMGALLIGLERVLAPALGGGLTLRLAALALLVGAGVAAFVLLALALGVIPWGELRRRLLRA
jgi:putative peptidoglycan lipid II flippase